MRYLLHHGADPELRDADGKAVEAAAAAVGDEARAAVLDVLLDPSLLLVSKAKAANGLYRAGEYAAATAAYEAALLIAAESPEACTDQDLATLHFNCARAALKEGRHITALDQAPRGMAHGMAWRTAWRTAWRMAWRTAWHGALHGALHGARHGAPCGAPHGAFAHRAEASRLSSRRQARSSDAPTTPTPECCRQCCMAS